MSGRPLSDLLHVDLKRLAAWAIARAMKFFPSRSSRLHGAQS